MGYHRAGFRVIGVDVRQQKRYPFEFHLMDAFDALATNLRHVTVIHASPPCQHYSVGAKSWNTAKNHPDLVATIRDALIATGKPYVIENIPQAPLKDPIRLCGTMFGLPLIRHRMFESGDGLVAPEHRRHTGRVRAPYVTVTGYPGYSKGGTVADWRRAMGIPWMAKDELSQAIPPAYTEYVGRQALEWVR